MFRYSCGLYSHLVLREKIHEGNMLLVCFFFSLLYGAIYITLLGIEKATLILRRSTKLTEIQSLNYSTDTCVDEYQCYTICLSGISASIKISPCSRNRSLLILCFILLNKLDPFEFLILMVWLLILRSFALSFTCMESEVKHLNQLSGML